MAQQRRVYKVAEQIRSLIATQLHRLSDPRFSLVTITSVQLSPDMRNAKVYWTVSGPKHSHVEARLNEIEHAFKGAAGSFRREIAQDLGLRSVPEVRFYYDDTLDVIERTRDLFDRVHEKESRPKGEGHISEVAPTEDTQDKKLA